MKVLTVDKSLEFIGKFLPVAKSYLVKDVKDVKPRFPLVLKIVSPKAIHKTKFKGIRIVHDQEGLNKEFNDLISIAKKKYLKLSGILVQEFIKGKELIIGIKNDPSFGHVLMFGIGGVFVELLKDVSFRVCPISEKDASAMINDLKAKDILSGFRGEKPVNLNLLKKILVKASHIPDKNKDILELDINPLIINEKQGFVVDARLLLG